MYYDAYFGIYPRSELHQISSSNITCPLGQLAIATQLRVACPDVAVGVYYGETTDESLICSDIDNRAARCKKVLVGLTLNAGGARRALALARHFNSRGMDVILGGPEVSLDFREQGIAFLEDKPYVRGIGLGPAEHLVENIVRDGWSSDITNLVYRKEPGGEVIVGDLAARGLDFDQIHVDYGLLYGVELLSGVSYLWRTDCHQAHGQRCYFCGRMEFGRGSRSPARVWEELRQARDQWGIRVFYNVADSVTVDPGALQRFVEAQPNDFGGEIHRCFVNAYQVNAETIECLSRLNAIAALGLESRDLFNTVGKKFTTTEINEVAVQALNRARIPMSLSFVLGLPGESEGTLDRTGEYIEEMVERYPAVISIEISPLTVTTGSKAFRDTLKACGDKYRNRAMPYDIVELSTDYFASCCYVSRRAAIRKAASVAESLRKTRPDLWIDIKGLTIDERRELAGDLQLGSESSPYSNERCVHGERPITTK